MGGDCRNFTAVVMAAPVSPLEVHPHRYVLRVPVPGVLRHTCKLHLKDETLIVSGAWEGGGAVAYGSVYRAVPLPPDELPTGFEPGLEAGSFVVRLLRRPR